MMGSGGRSLAEEYSDKCYEFYLRTLDMPSPLDQFEIVPLIPMNIGNFYFSFTNPSLFMLLTLSFFLHFVLVYMMTNRFIPPASSSSSSSSSNNKRREKRKAKEDLIVNLVVKEVDEYLTTHRESLIKEFPGAFPYIETPAFLTKVSTDLLRGAGLPGTADPASMEILHMVHKNFLDSFEIVKEEGYRNHLVYDSVRCFLKHFRSD